MNASKFSRSLHRSPASILMICFAVLYVFFFSGKDVDLPPQGEEGLCLPPPAMWNLPMWPDVVGGLLLNVGVLFLMALINKTFNVLRSNTRLQLGLFAIMSAAVPRLVININSGIVLALAMNLCILLLFASYGDPVRGVRRVFLSFLILSAGSAIQYCFVLYIPVLWLITAQMRIFSLRAFLASVFGIVAPWIILLGFGLISPEQFHVPHVIGLFNSFEELSAIYLLTVAGITAFLLFLSVVLNLSKTIAYNAQARAYNGALTLIAIVTILAILFNYNNLPAYMPLLNVCAAYQITHFFVNHRFDRQYIAVLSICIVFLLLYVWRIIL